MSMRRAILELSAAKPHDQAFGPCVELRSIASAKEGKWNPIAYEVDLKGRDLAVTRQHFEECVANFKRNPRAPIVIEHADTRWDADELPDDWRSPHGWVLELRVGEFKRPDGSTVASLEARCVLDDATRGDVTADPPKWPYVSATLFFNTRSEETGDYLGTILYSLSLTAHPALVDLPQFVASQRTAAPPKPRGQEAAKEPQSMLTLVMLAAVLGRTAKDETEAGAIVRAAIEDKTELHRALALPIDAPRADAISKIAELTTQASRVGKLEKDLEESKASVALAVTEATKRVEHLSALFAARPELNAARPAIEVFARTDYAAFAAAYPIPEAKPAADAKAPTTAHTKPLDVALSDARKENKASSPRAARAPQDVAGGQTNDVLSAATALAAQNGVSLSVALDALTKNGVAKVDDAEVDELGE
jgi:hypothetical protein